MVHLSVELKNKNVVYLVLYLYINIYYYFAACQENTYLLKKIITTYNTVGTFFSSATGLIFFVPAIVDAVAVGTFRVKQIFCVHQLQR